MPKSPKNAPAATKNGADQIIPNSGSVSFNFAAGATPRNKSGEQKPHASSHTGQNRKRSSSPKHPHHASQTAVIAPKFSDGRSVLVPDAALHDALKNGRGKKLSPKSK